MPSAPRLAPFFSSSQLPKNGPIRVATRKVLIKDATRNSICVMKSSKQRFRISRGRNPWPGLLATLLLAVSVLPGWGQNVGSALDGFDPDCEFLVESVAMQPDGKILIGGPFVGVGGVTRNGIARLHPDGSVDAAFDPNISGFARIAIQSDGKILVGGGFTSVGGVTRNNIARLNTDGTLDTSFNPNANGRVRSLEIQPDGKILVSGEFSSIGGVPRDRVARLNADGSLDMSFNPNINDRVITFAVQTDGRILMAGAFTSVNGVPRNRVARLNADGSMDSTFDPNANEEIVSIKIQADGKILMVGAFTGVGGVTRNRIARLNTDGSVDTTFNPDANGSITSLAIQPDGKILMGGGFSTIGGITRIGIARLNWDGTVDTDFAQYVIDPVNSFAFQADGKILIGGSFTSVGGVARNYIARLHADGSVEKDLDAGANTEVWSLVPQPNGKILIGGAFTTIGGQSRNHIARLEADGSLDTDFNPNADRNVRCLALQPDGKILVGGSFGTIAGGHRPRVARLNPDGSLDTNFSPPIVNDNVRSLLLQLDGRILVGGGFQFIGVESRNRIARLNSNGSLDTTFNPNADGNIYSLALQADGKILVGGDFSTIAGATRSRIARLNPDGSIDAGFSPPASEGGYYCLAVQADGKILVGGGFSSIDGVTRNSIARLHADGSLDAGFNPNANMAVRCLALQTDGKILVGGQFTSVGGVTRNRIARLNPDGSLDTGFISNASNTVVTVGLQADGKVLVGGGFTSIGGVTRNCIARLTNEAAFQDLDASEDGTSVNWHRGGSNPEVDHVALESSADDGATWAPLGTGSRIGASSDWQLTGLALPMEQNLLIRARGQQMANSSLYGGSSLYESVRQVYLPDLTPPAVINEVDSYTQSGDTREFIELYDGGTGNTALDGLALVFYDGNTDTSYHAVDLDGHSTNDDGYFVVGNTAVANVDLVIPDSSVQSSSEAVALYQGDATEFPNGSGITTTALLDALLYGSLSDPGLEPLLLPGESAVNESANGGGQYQSVQRYPNGTGGPRATGTYRPLAPTPGEPNTLATVEFLNLDHNTDSGNNGDGITNAQNPRFIAVARIGALVNLVSDLDGEVGSSFSTLIGDPRRLVLINTSNLSEGVHELTATADGGAASEPFILTIDRTAPPAPSAPDLDTGNDSGISDSDDITKDTNLHFSGSSTGADLILLYANGSLLSSQQAPENTPESWSVSTWITEDGNYDIAATSKDVAGNESAPGAVLNVTIDTTAPAPTVEQAIAQDDPATSGPIQFTVDFGEDVDGFETTDVTTGGSAAGAVSISGGNSSFTVEVATTADEGFVTASLVGSVVTDLAGNSNAASTSSDNRVDIDSDGGPGGSPTELALDTGSTSFAGFLGSSDTDTFTFTLAANRIATLFTTGALDTRGVLEDATDTLLNDPDADDDAGDELNFRTVETLAAGDYTLALTASGEGDYELTLETAIPPAPAPLPAAAENALLISKTKKQLKKLKAKIKKAKQGGNVAKAKKLKQKFKKLKKLLKSL